MGIIVDRDISTGAVNHHFVGGAGAGEAHGDDAVVHVKIDPVIEDSFELIWQWLGKSGAGGAVVAGTCEATATGVFADGDPAFGDAEAIGDVGGLAVAGVEEIIPAGLAEDKIGGVEIGEAVGVEAVVAVVGVAVEVDPDGVDGVDLGSGDEGCGEASDEEAGGFHGRIFYGEENADETLDNKMLECFVKAR